MKFFVKLACILAALTNAAHLLSCATTKSTSQRSTTSVGAVLRRSIVCGLGTYTAARLALEPLEKDSSAFLVSFTRETGKHTSSNTHILRPPQDLANSVGDSLIAHASPGLDTMVTPHGTLQDMANTTQGLLLHLTSLKTRMQEYNATLHNMVAQCKQGASYQEMVKGLNTATQILGNISFGAKATTRTINEQKKFSTLVAKAVNSTPRNEKLLYTLLSQASREDWHTEAEQLYRALDGESKKISVIVQHILKHDTTLSEPDRWLIAAIAYFFTYRRPENSILQEIRNAKQNVHNNQRKWHPVIRIQQLSRAFLMATANGDLLAMQNLIAHGARIEGPQEAANVLTPLHAAAGLGNAATVQWLLDNGADACRTTADGKTALWHAHNQTIRNMLLKAQAQQQEYARKHADELREQEEAAYQTMLEVERRYAKTHRQSTHKQQRSTPPTQEVEVEDDEEPNDAAQESTSQATTTGQTGAGAGGPEVHAANASGHRTPSTHSSAPSTHLQPRRNNLDVAYLLPLHGEVRNGVYYTRHAFERMAPDTPAVRAELARRARARRLDPESADYTNAIQPRDITTQEVERVLKDAYPVYDENGYTCTAHGITVALSRRGEILTVIR